MHPIALDHWPLKVWCHGQLGLEGKRTDAPLETTCFAGSQVLFKALLVSTSVSPQSLQTKVFPCARPVSFSIAKRTLYEQLIMYVVSLRGELVKKNKQTRCMTRQAHYLWNWGCHTYGLCNSIAKHPELRHTKPSPPELALSRNGVVWRQLGKDTGQVAAGLKVSPSLATGAPYHVVGPEAPTKTRPRCHSKCWQCNPTYDTQCKWTCSWTQSRPWPLDVGMLCILHRGCPPGLSHRFALHLNTMPLE